MYKRQSWFLLLFLTVGGIAGAAYYSEPVHTVAGASQGTVLGRISTATEPGRCESVTTVSEALLAANADRKFVSVVAASANTAAVYLKLGATATSSNIPLAAGDTFTLSGDWMYTGTIDILAASGTQSLCVVAY